MELLTKTRGELLGYAEKMELKPAKTISDDKLRTMVETEAIRRTVEMEETARLRLQEESRMRREIAEIRAEAELRSIAIKIPKKPALADIVKLKKKLNLMISEPKPSPETLAIEASKKVYAVFHNMEQKDMDIPHFTVGGKYWFHLWPEKVHVLPEWLIGHWRRTARVPIHDKKMVANPQAIKIGDAVEKSVRVGWERRFLFDILGDAPDKASFGVVLDAKIVSKLLPEEL